MPTSPSPRIAICFEYPTLNGGERSMLAVLDALGDAARRFVMVAPPDGPLAEAMAARGRELVPLSIHDADGRRIPRDEAATRLGAAIRDSGAELVHANSLSLARLTGAVAGELACPCTGHLRDIIKLSRAAIADLNRNAHLVAVSEATRDFHCARGLATQRTMVIHNGIDVNQFQPQPSSGWLRRELGLPDTALLCATIGQIGLRKGQDVLAAAARKVAAEFPEAHYLLIGERNSGKQENIDFENALPAAFPPGRLHRLGVRNDVPRLLNEIDLLVHPARQEPFGRVLLEAAACGRAIMATDVGGTAEMLIDGESAMLVPPDDVDRLAAELRSLLADADRRGELGAAARRRIVARFTIERAADALQEFWWKQFRAVCISP